jgi:acyl-CoA thioesterase
MPTDAEFLGLTPLDDAGRFHFRVVNHLARLDGHLYGGTAIAVSIAAAEAVSERAAVWMTTQYVATAPPGEELTVQAEVLAPGRRTNQVRVTCTNPDGRVMFASLGATGHHRDGVAGEYENAPVVDPPEVSPPWGGPLAGRAEMAGFEPPPLPPGVGFNASIEFRAPTVHDHPDPGPGRMCLWVRRRDRTPVTPAVAAFMADMVPLSVSMAAGVVAGGTSLDNTIRIGAFEPTEWVLVDLRPHLAAGDYGHGAAHIWSESGHLLAAASQSCSMFRFDPRNLPWDERNRRRAED